MIYNNYIPTCKYHLGDLKDKLYLIPFTQKIKYNIDDENQPYADIDVSSCSILECSSVSFTEESSIDGRYSFQYTITARFFEEQYKPYFDVIQKLKDKEYHIVVETKEGVYWLINNDFPYSFSYSYELSDVNNNATLTFKCKENTPTMICRIFNSNFYDYILKKGCSYNHANIDYFDIIESEYVKIDGNKMYLLNGAHWKTVKPLNRTFSHISSLQNDVFKNTVEFTIELDDYLSAFHYNILEFTKNRYVVKYKTLNGNTIVVGKEFGLQPQFSISTDKTLNTIKITLVEGSSSDDSVVAPTDLVTYSQTKPNGFMAYASVSQSPDVKTLTVECISPTMAKRLLAPIKDSSGNETGEYLVLEGYEEQFQHINGRIIGTFNEANAKDYDISLYIDYPLCENMFGCSFHTDFNSVIVVEGGVSKTLCITSKCPWEIKYNGSKLSFSKRSSDLENDCFDLVFNNGEYGEEQEFVIEVDGVPYTYTVMIDDPHGCFIIDSDKVINADAQSIFFKTNGLVGMNTIRIPNLPPDLIYMLSGFDIEIKIPRNNAIQERGWKFAVMSGDRMCELNITQKGKTEGGDGEQQERWVNTQKTNCTGGNLYVLQQKQVSTDGVNWKNVESYRDGELIEENSSTCKTPEETEKRWVQSTTDTTCYNNIAYYIEYEEEKVNGVWNRTGLTRRGEATGNNSVCENCVVEYAWRDSNETICNGDDLYYKAYYYWTDDCWNTKHKVGDDYTYGSIKELGGCANPEYKWVYIGEICGSELIDGEFDVIEDNDPIVNPTGDTPNPPIVDPDEPIVNPTGSTKYWIGDDEYTISIIGKLQPNIIPSSATKIEIGESVTTISKDAFYSYSSLTSITIPDSVTSIGDYAFSYCTNLTSIIIPDNVVDIGIGIFASCENLETIILSNSITSIASTTFFNCSNLTSITIPSSVITIANNAFYGCSSLTSITIPDSVTSIGGWTFSNCTNLTSVTIPDGITVLRQYTFNNCTSLESVAIGSGVTSIDDYAFFDCTSLTSITISDSVGDIGERAFGNVPTEGELSCDKFWYNNLSTIMKKNIGKIYYWDKIFVTNKETICETRYWLNGIMYLTLIEGTLKNNTLPSNSPKVNIGNCVTSISNYAFSACTSLISVTIPDSVTSIGTDAFHGCTNLTSVAITNGVTSIGESTFSNCSSLTSITIPDSVTSIGQNAFLYCTKLSSVTIGDGVTSIGNYAFSNCSKLTSVTIGDSVTRFGNYTFQNCSKLTSVTYTGTKAQWDAIIKGKSWKFGVPSTCIVHCTDGDIYI